MAAKVMKEEGVPVDELNSLMMQHLDLARGDRFHLEAGRHRVAGKTSLRYSAEGVSR